MCFLRDPVKKPPNLGVQSVRKKVEPYPCPLHQNSQETGWRAGYSKTYHRRVRRKKNLLAKASENGAKNGRFSPILDPVPQGSIREGCNVVGKMRTSSVPIQNQIASGELHYGLQKISL